MENSNPEVNGPAQVSGGEKNIFMGILSYLGPLVIISYLTSKDDPFVKFHVKQGLVLLVIEVAIWFLSMLLMYSLWPLIKILNLATVVLAIIGIVNVVNGKEKELPVVGKYSSRFNF